MKEPPSIPKTLLIWASWTRINLRAGESSSVAGLEDRDASKDAKGTVVAGTCTLAGTATLAC